MTDQTSERKHLSTQTKSLIAGICALVACVLWLVNYFVIQAVIFPKAIETPSYTVALIVVCAIGSGVFGLGQIIRQSVVSILGGLLFIAGTGILVYLFIVADIMYYLPQSWMLLAIGMLLYGWVASPSDKGKQTPNFMYYLPAFCGLFAFASYFPWALQLFAYSGAECILWVLFDLFMAVSVGMAAWMLKPAQNPSEATSE